MQYIIPVNRNLVVEKVEVDISTPAPEDAFYIPKEAQEQNAHVLCQVVSAPSNCEFAIDDYLIAHSHMLQEIKVVGVRNFYILPFNAVMAKVVKIDMKVGNK